MPWYRWEVDDYPVCPKCKRASVSAFKPFKKGIEHIYGKIPEGFIPVTATCLWGHEVKAVIPVEWKDRVHDPNNILEDWL